MKGVQTTTVFPFEEFNWTKVIVLFIYVHKNIAYFSLKCGITNPEYEFIITLYIYLHTINIIAVPAF